MTASPALWQVGVCDDGEPLCKDESSRRFEKLLNGLQTPQEFTELRQFIIAHPTLSDERRAFYGRACLITARFSHGFTFNPQTGEYAAPTA